MLSLVVMTAVSVGSAAPDFGCNYWWGCCGCFGCYKCNGCMWGCHGCSCGCPGCAYGPFDWGHGCGYVCYGGGHGHGPWPPAGCWGPPFSCYNGCWSCGGPPPGAFGIGAPGYGAPGSVAPGMSTPSTPSSPTPPKNGEEKPRDKEEVIQTSIPHRARLIIDVPADAKLFIDERLTKSTSERRTFSTPVLEDGEVYYYEVRVELFRKGEPLVENRKLTLRAGDVIRADFRDMERTATARAGRK